jgi:hypothetical protein
MSSKRYQGFKSSQHSLRSEVPLTNEQIAAVAPSIVAEDKHDSRSKNYTYIPTVKVIDALRKEGFEPFMVAQSKPKDDDRLGFARHMIRLRHASMVTANEANEIILVNSHDGTSSYQMLAGMFRFVCQNGIVAGDLVQDIRVPHRGNVIDNVIEGSYRILDEFELIEESRDEMKAIALTRPEQMAFARSAMALKYDKVEEAPIVPEQLIRPQRHADTNDDLWSTFNRVQEHMVKGGVHGRTAQGTRTRTRGINSISDNVKLNAALWTLAESMKQLKAGRELEAA